METTENELEQFKSGIFKLGTNFGELAQLMIQELEGFSPANGKNFDLLDKSDQKIEVKFSRCKKKPTSIKKSNIIDICINAAINSMVLTETDSAKETFDCIIQQIKPSEFDVLYYGIFFKDKIVIFKAKSNDIPNMPGYSKQHSGGIEYQFHIKKSNYAYHKGNYFYKELSYSKLFNLFKNE